MKVESLMNKKYSLSNIEAWKQDLMQRAKEDTILNTKWFKDRDIKSAVEWLEEQILDMKNIKQMGDNWTYEKIRRFLKNSIDQAFEDITKKDERG